MQMSRRKKLKPIPKSSKNKDSSQGPMEEKQHNWPERPDVFSELMTPVEAAMFLRLDQIDHTPATAIQTLNYWRERHFSAVLVRYQEICKNSVRW